MKFIDLRSDTVTHPTDTMRKRMAEALVGDDVYGDDPTVLELEAASATLLGKEAAMFVPSGVFGNQVAILTHTQRGQEIILGEHSHIIVHEAGAAALIASVQTRTVDDRLGFMDPEAVERLIRKTEDIHFPRTGLLCVETAHSTGHVAPLENLKTLRALATAHGLPIHMDGARLFNAAAALNVEPRTLAACADSVSFCLSKGLCAPVGSMVVGSRAFIHAARKNRKILGGGLRQAGILAAAGLEALTLSERLSEDHENARYLGARLAELPAIEVDLDSIQINMVFFKIQKEGFQEEDFIRHLNNHGVLLNGQDEGQFRFVTHYYITRDRIDTVIQLIRDFLA